MTGKYSEWKQNQKQYRKDEIRLRKEMKLKWRGIRADQTILNSIPVRTEFSTFDPTPIVIPPPKQ